MLHTPLRPQDIEVFTEAITHYFSASTGELASVRSAYLLERGGPVIWNDFNGLSEISGDYQGSVCFSAPRALLSHVLLKMGESVFTDERHGDIVELQHGIQLFGLRAVLGRIDFDRGLKVVDRRHNVSVVRRK